MPSTTSASPVKTDMARNGYDGPADPFISSFSGYRGKRGYRFGYLNVNSALRAGAFRLAEISSTNQRSSSLEVDTAFSQGRRPNRTFLYVVGSNLHRKAEDLCFAALAPVLLCSVDYPLLFPKYAPYQD